MNQDPESSYVRTDEVEDLSPIFTFGRYKDNGELIAAVERLGYLEGYVLDTTYGRGTFWKTWQPPETHFWYHDLALDGVDFRHLPYRDEQFDSVVFDPPYKLNGTPTVLVDARYGVHTPARWQDRMQLCYEGATECLRVLLEGGYLLFKCQDQVVSGKKVFQTIHFVNHCAGQGATLVDMLHIESYRPQPVGTRQVHSRQNYSSLLIFQKGR